MSFFVTVTFDLQDAGPSQYQKIQEELRHIRFGKLIRGKRVKRKLTHNTFTADFSNADFEKSSELCAEVGAELCRIFKRHAVQGKYFVTAGKRWAWKMGRVK